MKIFERDPLFKEIYKINIIYANPNVANQLMRKGKYRIDTDELVSKILFKNVIAGSVAMLFIYSLFFMIINFSKVPFLYDFLTGAIILLNIFQTFTYYYNVFYESRDVFGYMPLPIREKTVFYSKLAAVTVSSLQLSVPLLVCSVFFHYRISGDLVKGIIFGIIDYAVYLSAIIIFNAFITNMFAKISLLSRFRKTIINAITFITMIVNGGFIVFINIMSGRISPMEYSNKTLRYGPLSWLLRNDISYAKFILGAAVLLFILYKLSLGRAEKNFYEYIMELNDSKNSFKKKSAKEGKKRENKNLFTLFVKYNFSLLSDTTVISETFLSLIFPVLTIVPSIVNSGKDAFVKTLSANGIISAIVLAMFFSFVSGFSNLNIAGIIISLDRDNYEYIKALPVSQKEYIMIKYVFCCIFNTAVTVILLWAVEIFFLHFSLLQLLVSAAVTLAVYIPVTLKWIIYDYKHLNTGWQNTMELYSRTSKGLIFLFYFLAVLMLYLVIFAFKILISSVYGLTFAVIIIIAVILALIYSLLRGIDFFNSLD